MFWRSLCAFAMLASPAAAEILVQDGDYYPFLEGPVRITGGRVDQLMIGGNAELIIEGGSIGEIIDNGNSEYVFRTGGFQLDVEPIDLFDIAFITVEGYAASTRGTTLSMWFADSTSREIVFAAKPEYPDAIANLTFIPTPLFSGDTNGDDLVDLGDLNNVRNNFGSPGLGDTDGDRDIDLDDLNAVRNNFGVDYRNSSRPVPEPATLTLLLAGMTGPILRPWWRCNASRGLRRPR